MKKYALILVAAVLLCSSSFAADLAVALALPNHYYVNQKLNISYDGPDFTVRARQSITESRYGTRGLNSIFKNFSEGHNIDWNVNGVKKNFDLINSGSENSAKGAVRTHLFATAIYNTPGLELLAVDEPVRAIGSNRIMTDKDIVARDVLTGRRIRFEVKDVSPSSQNRNFAKYKTQLDKMAAEYRRTGEKQIWINRRELHPRIAAYAAKLGIAVEGNVTTSKNETVLQKNRSINDVLAHNSSTMRITHAAQLGMGVYGLYMLAKSAPAIYSTWEQFITNSDRGEVDYVNVAQVSMQFGVGAIFTARGMSATVGSLGGEGLAEILGKRLPRIPFESLGRYAGVIGYTLMAVDLGLDVYSYTQGHMSSRDFTYAASTKIGGFVGTWGGALVGGAAGAKAGSLVGAIGGPAGATAGATIGLTIGSIAGGIAGGFSAYWGASSLAMFVIEQYYKLEDPASQTEHLEFLLTYYQANSP